jgi:hypothetical protein
MFEQDGAGIGLDVGGQRCPKIRARYCNIMVLELDHPLQRMLGITFLSLTILQQTSKRRNGCIPYLGLAQN